METFKIPVTWSVYGTVDIEADNIAEAIDKFEKEKDDMPLPCDSHYVDDSFEMSYDKDELIELTNKGILFAK